MNRSSSRKVKLTSKFEEFKLTANGKKRGRPRKSWPQNEQHPQTPMEIKPTIPQTPREELLRTREENHHITTPITPKQNVSRPMSSKREELLRLREENVNLKSKLDQITADFEELKRQSSYTGQTVPKVDYDDLKERYQRDITYAKRHEWCVLCLNLSRYYCCWNTTYCSQKCQVADWYSRHGKSCERRKSIKNVS
uniref:Protein kinase C-binding protein 1 n=1 Tax=Aceria tosichella TaxID=561515 RepID=A0A6G1SKL8_9ACAR